MTDLVNVLEDMSIGLEEALVEEVVAFDTSKSESPDVLGGLGDFDGVDVELGSGAFPGRPGLCTADALLLVRAGETLVVGGDKVVALVLGDRLDVLIPCVYLVVFFCCCCER